MKAFNFIFFTFLFSSSSMASCQNNLSVQKINFSGHTQGTYYSITYFDYLNRNLQPQLERFFKNFEQTASLWEKQSILCRVNKNDPSVVLNNTFIDIFNKSEEMAQITNGAFDFTIGPLTSAWGFGFENRTNLTKTQIDSLLQLVGYKKIQLKNGKIQKENPAMQMDFNALAKGYSVDLVAKYFDSVGIKNYLIDIGGEVTGRGYKPGGGTWLVGIEKPTNDKDADRKIFSKVKLENMSLATSGNYRKYYEENGVRYSHTINPETGYPAKHTLLSASVLAKECWRADAYATAFMVMGTEKAIEFLKTHPGIDAYFIYDKDGTLQTFSTKGFSQNMVN